MTHGASFVKIVWKIRIISSTNVLMLRWIWQSLGSAGIGNASLESEVNDWIINNVKESSRDSNWPTKFTRTYWYIWNWRNAVCFRPLEDISHDNSWFLRGKFEETIGCWREATMSVTEPPRLRWFSDWWSIERKPRDCRRGEIFRGHRRRMDWRL